MTKIARHAKAALELIHAMIYFAPEAEERYTALGLEKGRMGYYASRSAAMGPVGPGVVAATFYNFNPTSVARSIPKAWKIAAPERILEARLDAVDAAMHRMLGAEVLASDGLAKAADLARTATEGCLPEGKPLYAAHADLAWPELPHTRLWHAISLLREFRGDAHLAALQDAGLTGLQALVLQVATGEGLNEKFSKATRGWSDEEWSAAKEKLAARGLIDDGLTEQGRQLREDVEAATDAMSMGPWRHLGQEKVERLLGRGAELSRTVAKAGAFPSSAFGRD